MTDDNKRDEYGAWYASGNRLCRFVNGDFGGADNDFPMLNEEAADRLSRRLNADHNARTQLEERVRELEAALRGVEATDIEKLPMDADQAVALFVIALDKTRDIARRALLSPQEPDK